MFYLCPFSFLPSYTDNTRWIIVFQLHEDYIFPANYRIIKHRLII